MPQRSKHDERIALQNAMTETGLEIGGSDRSFQQFDLANALNTLSIMAYEMHAPDCGYQANPSRYNKLDIKKIDADKKYLRSLKHRIRQQVDTTARLARYVATNTSTVVEQFKDDNPHQLDRYLVMAIGIARQSAGVVAGALDTKPRRETAQHRFLDRLQLVYGSLEGVLLELERMGIDSALLNDSSYYSEALQNNVGNKDLFQYTDYLLEETFSEILDKDPSKSGNDVPTDKPDLSGALGRAADPEVAPEKNKGGRPRTVTPKGQSRHRVGFTLGDTDFADLKAFADQEEISIAEASRRLTLQCLRHQPKPKS